MKTENLFIALSASALIAGVALKDKITPEPMLLVTVEKPVTEEKPCVFMSVMGEQPVNDYAVYKNDSKTSSTITEGQKWLINAQNKDGGWGAGSHSNQGEMNPHAVSSDPATTAMAAMALYRCGYTIEKGAYKQKLSEALNYLLNEVEKNKNNDFITQIRNTQIQTKLGQNIDAVLTLQFLNQVVPTLSDRQLTKRVENAIQICVDKIEKSYDASGKVSGAGWAGVLQSSFANSGLEQASKNKNIKVSKDKIDAARNYQKSNYDADSNTAKTDDGAGIMLYAVSSSVRGSAGEAKEAETLLEQAKASGKIDRKAILNRENLEKIGISREKAASYEVADKVYKAAKVQAMDDNVMSGFGNNGGEEFLSFLQTGESMIVKKDNDWKTWYDNVSGKMLKIQNQDGSWNGHHCITSPVFCTATCLLILTIENDIKNLQQ
nr:prenyltransferase/squalene oxidase repeat-containing protein [uncultured Flavobacterium sp.]